ncbi:hypothetical protein BJ875DRAFT_532939 [Amylocarpus encephaloides]|uniref:Uncharacterized protein n=1 Tax=Amylocarpus encephaloides TaxID=45428 RepID=A0A9P8C872_9HELO|nr:hypothetical protein BJ875DRAFT_532939 [Amylocarpus encephaloides]
MSTLFILLAVGQSLAALQQQHLLHHADSTNKLGWNLNFSSTAPHYFASAYGLLQQWPDTFFLNGHSIAPCEILPLTNLYHGRRDGELPPSPEWIAFDIGMAYGIMGGSRNSHMLTYQTTRKTRCVYFDGESATLFGTGQMDTQNLHIYGNVSGPDKPPGGQFDLWDEYARASGLCDWLHESGLGGPGQYEGIVRMNAGFEMIWCNFSSPSVRLISHLNVTAPLLSRPTELDAILENTEQSSYYPLPPVPTRTDRSTSPSDPPARPNLDHRNDLLQEPFRSTQAWNWFASSTLHYGSSGEGAGLGETRKSVKLLNLTKEGYWVSPDEDGPRSIALQALTRRRRFHLLDAISPQDASRMRNDSERVLKSLLVVPYDNCSGVDWTSHTFLLPFLEYPEEVPDPRMWSADSDLFKRTYSLCKYDHTLEIGMSIESLWQSRFNTVDDSPTSTLQEMKLEVIRWTHGIEELMAWLGWAGEWVRCEKKCAWDEKCFVPMWPMMPMLRPLGYGTPGSGYPPTYGYPPRYGPPTNHTSPGRGGPGRGFKWHQDETNLWKPICVMPDFLSSR